MGLLSYLGFSPKTFSEVILVLRTEKGTYVQPLGVKIRGLSLWARVFKSTELHKHLRKGLKGSLNITHDPRAFFEPVMYGRLLSLEIRNSHLGPYLASSEAIVFIEIANITRERAFSSVFFRPCGIVIEREHPLVFNRAFSALIEALVHLTRIWYYARSCDIQLVEALAEKVRMCVETVRHATEESAYLDMASEILYEARKWASLTRELTSLPERGVYTLVVRLEEDVETEIGSLGMVKLAAGYHLYTGSALGRGALGLRRRIARHLSRIKKPFWHIDYLLKEPKARVEAIIVAGSEIKKECEVNKALMNELRAIPSAPGLGSSDCRSKCPAHLLYVGPSSPIKAIERVYQGLGLKPIVVEVGKWR